LTDLFAALTDSLHKANFEGHAALIMHLFCVACKPGHINVPLWDPSQHGNSFSNNLQFVSEFVVNLLSTAFPHVARQIILNLVAGISNQAIVNCNPASNKHEVMEVFKGLLKDFLVQLKEFANAEDSDFVQLPRVEEKKSF
jgi:exportin-1